VAELRAAALDPDDPKAALPRRFLRTAEPQPSGRLTPLAQTNGPMAAGLERLLYRDQRRNDDALKVLRDAVAEWVNDAPMRVRLVAFLTSIGRLDDAERECDAAQQLFAGDEQVHAARGDLARERAVRAEAAGNAEDAADGPERSSYRRALEISRIDPLKKLVAGADRHARKAPRRDDGRRAAADRGGAARQRR
jgi:hypothetical protein